MKKILVAEDDKFLAAAYKAKLGKLGWEVRVAGDGAEALEILGEFVPDAILLDLVMPRMDGFAVLVELKKNPAWAKIPVLVASNLGQKEDIDRSRELGAVGYVVKADLSIDELVRKIEEAI
ncbi:MAG: hypothetical protein G01um101416_828 [Microgenomates group bacterium Gr01-1014_16]|nr:MAG: hypothetical protein G01um101416_828 [Microgenomates group bacterium Gr01-1014_16]